MTCLLGAHQPVDGFIDRAVAAGAYYHIVPFICGLFGKLGGMPHSFRLYECEMYPMCF